MSIGSFLATGENLELVKKNSWKFGRPKIIEMGMRYYEQHPEQVQVVADNLERMELPCTGAALDEVLRPLSDFHIGMISGDQQVVERLRA